MNLKQLRAFREVMLTGSVSEAARSLLRTQPTISALIASLEEEVGYALFERRGRRLIPLPEAEFLFKEAEIILDRLTSTERIAKEIQNLEYGSLKLVTVTGPSMYLLPDMISTFLEGRENIDVSLHTRSAVEVERLVSTQQYDLGLADISRSEFEESPLVNHEILKFPCLCALRASDPLAKKAFITANDLSGLPVGTLYDIHPSVLQLRNVFDQAGAKLNIRIQTVYFLPLLTFAERGVCYSIVDPIAAYSYQQYWNKQSGAEIVFRPFSPAVHLITSIMTPAHRPMSHIVSAFSSILRDQLDEISNAFHPQS